VIVTYSKTRALRRVVKQFPVEIAVLECEQRARILVSRKILRNINMISISPAKMLSILFISLLKHHRCSQDFFRRR
jgi:hypothetical protein